MKIYPTRYQAVKNRAADEITVKVSGGYVNMKYHDYQVWRRQK